MGKEQTLQIRLTADEKEAFAKYCEENDLTMSQVLRKYIKELIKQND